MRKLTYSIMAFCLILTSFIQTGCFGEFALTRKVYTWNNGIAKDDKGGKIVKTLVFYVLNIIPVYTVAGIIDVVLLNLIEFWTGSNPLAMKAGETEKQTILKDGITYEITATQNRFDLTILDGEKAGISESVVFNPQEKTWSLITIAGETKLMQYSDDFAFVTMFTPNGKITTVADEKNMASAFVLSNTQMVCK